MRFPLIILAPMSSVDATSSRSLEFFCKYSCLSHETAFNIFPEDLNITYSYWLKVKHLIVRTFETWKIYVNTFTQEWENKMNIGT